MCCELVIRKVEERRRRKEVEEVEEQGNKKNKTNEEQTREREEKNTGRMGEKERKFGLGNWMDRIPTSLAPPSIINSSQLFIS